MDFYKCTFLLELQYKNKLANENVSLKFDKNLRNPKNTLRLTFSKNDAHQSLFL